MKTRLNSDITGIMIHHSKDVGTSSGESLNKDYNTTPNFFGSPYDIFINRDGTIDLTPRWIYADDRFQYLKNIPAVKILSHKIHFYAGIGETEEIRKDYVHIAVAGDFDSQEVPKVQLNTLVNVVRTLVKGLQIDPRVNLKYHGDKVFTSCPGFLFVEKSYLILHVKDAFIPLTVSVITDSTLTINPRLSFTVQPTSTIIDEVITPAVEVSLVDNFDNVITSFTGDVTISIYTLVASVVVLSGTLTQTAIAGVATFDDLSIDTIGVSYVLEADSVGRDSEFSNTFNIIATTLDTIDIGFEDVSYVIGPVIQQVPKLDLGFEDVFYVTGSIIPQVPKSNLGFEDVDYTIL